MELTGYIKNDDQNEREGERTDLLMTLIQAAQPARPTTRPLLGFI